MKLHRYNVILLAAGAMDRGFMHRSSNPKTIKKGICCFSTKHAALKIKSKDWLAWNKNNVSDCWSDMSICKLLFQ